MTGKILREESRTLNMTEALDLGAELATQGNHKSATTMFKGVLKHDPEHFEAQSRLGASLFEMENYYEALYWFWRALKIEHRAPMALTNYGLCLAKLGHLEEGLPFLERAVYHAERHGAPLSVLGLCHNNLGNALEQVHRYEEALRALDKALLYTPRNPFPHYNRGIVLLRLNRQRDALDALDCALALDPGDADAHYNRGLGRLLLGDFAGGFADYEYRLITSTCDSYNLGLPAEKKWDGSDPKGKTILVHAEQGLGDTIQSLRFIRVLHERGASVVLIVHNAIRPMVHDWPLAKILPQGTDLTGVYDHWVALMSLPLYLGVKTAEDIPPPWVPPVDKDRNVKWGIELARLMGTGSGKRLGVGVCWAGQFQHKNDRHRSVPLKVFSTLFEADNCDFLSLQQMRPEDTHTFKELQGKHDNLSAIYLNDFRDTAAVMRNLDLVISADTAVAHLAGSLGVPTWILIPKFGTDWRWQLFGDKTPWYPSAMLMRQDIIGSWASTIANLRDRLRAGAAR